MGKTMFEVTPGKVWEGAEREAALNAIYEATHPDFRGHAGDRWDESVRGQRTILTYRNGTCLVLLSSLTDDEISHKLPASSRAEG